MHIYIYIYILAIGSSTYKWTSTQLCNPNSSSETLCTTRLDSSSIISNHPSGSVCTQDSPPQHRILRPLRDIQALTHIRSNNTCSKNTLKPQGMEKTEKTQWLTYMTCVYTFRNSMIIYHTIHKLGISQNIPKRILKKSCHLRTQKNGFVAQTS